MDSTTRRQRYLGSDRRAGSWARAKARSDQYRYVRERWKALGGVGLLALTGPAMALPFIDSGFQRGLLTGCAVTTVAGLLAFWVVQFTGTASVMMGDLGEQWTAGELRKLRGSGWRVVNHVRLRRWDIDHVLVGPGGVLALETKWSATPWEFDPFEDRIEGAVAQVRQNASDLERWANLRAVGVGGVQSVVFLWGAGTRDVPPDNAVQRLGPTTVVAGPHADIWRAQLNARSLTPDQVDSAWEVLAARCSVTDPLDQARQPLPPSVGELTMRLVIAVAGATAGFLVAGLALPWLGTLGWWLAACAGLLLPGIALHRAGQARYAAWGWLLGVMAMLVLAVVVLVQEFVT